MDARTGKGPRITSLLMAGALAAAAAAWLGASPDGILARSYSDALGDVDTSWGSRHAGNVWLSNAPADFDLDGAGRAGPAPLAVGDRITIGSRSGGQQAIEVTALDEVDGAAFGLAGARFQIVTGRAMGSPEASVVRFLYTVDAPLSKVSIPRSDRSL